MEFNCILQTSFSSTIRGTDYSDRLDLIAISNDSKVILLPSLTDNLKLKHKISPRHGFPAILRFGCGEGLLVSDNQGPIDVFDLNHKELLRSYLEHSDRVTGTDWMSDDSFVSSSKDGTVRLYSLTSPHSYSSLNMEVGVCGVRKNPFNANQIAFGTAKGKFFVYDVRNLSVPYLEVKGHSKTISSVLFLSNTEILTSSIDGVTRLWDLKKTVCTVNFVGHIHHSYFVGLDSFDDLISLGGEDSTVRIYKKNNPNYIASASLSRDSTYICGCSWLQSKSSEKEKYLVVFDNAGNMKCFVLKIF